MCILTYRLRDCNWMARSRQALAAPFNGHTADALDTIIEGATIHDTAQPGTLSREVMRGMVTPWPRRAFPASPRGCG